MYLVDSHCHLDQLDLSVHGGSLEKALSYAKSQGVLHMLCANITLEDFPNVLQIAKSFSAVSASVGLHPNENANFPGPSADEIASLASDEKVVAIGETGLDYYRSTGDLEWQRERFRQHIRAAKQVKKPLIVHSRHAQSDTLRLLQEEQADSIGGVLHCFTESWEMASAAIEMGFYISFSGIITFQNAKDIQYVVEKVPIEHMLIETDAPYLAPVPHRGRSNEPAYVRYVAEHIARLRGISLEKLAAQTTENFFKCFQRAKK